MLPVSQLPANYTGTVYGSESWVGEDTEGRERKLCQVWDFVGGVLVDSREMGYSQVRYTA